MKRAEWQGTLIQKGYKRLPKSSHLLGPCYRESQWQCQSISSLGIYKRPTSIGLLSFYPARQPHFTAKTMGWKAQVLSSVPSSDSHPVRRWWNHFCLGDSFSCSVTWTMNQIANDRSTISLRLHQLKNNVDWPNTFAVTLFNESPCAQMKC